MSGGIKLAALAFIILCCGGGCFVLRSALPSEYSHHLAAAAREAACVSQRVPTINEVLNASISALSLTESEDCRKWVHDGTLAISVEPIEVDKNTVAFRLNFTW